MKKIIIPTIITIFIIYGLYNFFNEGKINYVALGDSLAIGENPYGEISYSYADNVKDYFEAKDILKSYTKDYAKSGDTTNDLIKKINDNKKVIINGTKINIKRALRESNLVTISIGANDLMKKVNIKEMDDLENIDYKEIEEAIEEVTESVDKAIIEVKKYAKKEILLIGYYNPVNKMFLDDKKLDNLFKKIDNLYTSICEKEKITYISVYEEFKKHDDYLPNPLNIHPNYKGYAAISDKIIEYLEKNSKKLA